MLYKNDFQTAFLKIVHLLAIKHNIKYQALTKTNQINLISMTREKKLLDKFKFLLKKCFIDIAVTFIRNHFHLNRVLKDIIGCILENGLTLVTFVTNRFLLNVISIVTDVFMQRNI